MGVLRLLRTGKGPMDGWVARAYDSGVHSVLRDLVAALLDDVKADLADARRLLDVGCGPGQFTILIAEELPQVDACGVDLAPTMIDLARRHAAASPAEGRLRFEVADAAHLPFPDGHFDAVLSSGSIKHWEDPVVGLREMHRVLAPGGLAFVAEMNRAAPASAIESYRQRLRHWVFRLIYPRVFTKALSPDEARAIFSASPFGPPERDRLILDGCAWLFIARKAG